MSHTGGLAEAQPSQPVSPLREDEPAIQGMFGGFRDSLPSAMDGRLILLPGGGTAMMVGLGLGSGWTPTH
jgi:hypothetical protein